jgi:hypothetical protein
VAGDVPPPSLLIWWGLNKIVPIELSTTISDTFYGGLFSAAVLQRALGAFQAAVSSCQAAAQPHRPRVRS